MLPKTHIIWGAIFTFVVSIFFPIVSVPYLLLIFLSSFLIDFDHYMIGAIRTRSLNFGKILRYHDIMELLHQDKKNNGVRQKGDFHVFHTVEFHILVFLLGFLWVGFFYILIGMVFHSLLDVIELSRKDLMYIRHYWLINWLRR